MGFFSSFIPAAFEFYDLHFKRLLAVVDTRLHSEAVAANLLILGHINEGAQLSRSLIKCSRQLLDTSNVRLKCKL